MPVQGPVHVSKPLTNISIAYKAQGLVASEAFPTVPVQHETDQYFVFDKASLMRTPDTLRANGAEANEDNFALSTATYTLEEHALKDILTDRTRDNADPGLDLAVSITENLTDKVLRQREGDSARLLFTDGNWANEASLTSTFAFSANTTLSNPIIFVNSVASLIATSAGVKPNLGVFDYSTYLAMKEHTSIVDRIKYTSSDSVTPQLLARLFDLDRVLIASASENTAAEGLAVTMADIYTDSGWIGYVATNPGLRNPSSLYCFKKNGAGLEAKRWRDDPRNGEWIEITHMYDQVAPASDAGGLIVNTIQ